MNTNCKVIEDLMPLYIDKLTSEESNELIEEHLKTCHDCREKLLDLQKDLVADSPEKMDMTNSSEDQAQKLVMRIRNRMMALVSGTFLIAILIGMFSDIYIFSILAYLLLGTSLIVFISKVNRSSKYWLSGICMYLFSALAGFSIGLFTLSIAFILFAFAIGHSMNLIKRRRDSLISLVIGLSLWGIVINIYNGFWIFYPAIFLFELLFTPS